MSTPGHESGQAGLDWASYLASVIAERGSLAAVANHLAAQRGYEDDLGTIERGLRRLRERGHGDGGVWGRRMLAAFGLTQTIEDRLRWMGLYHTRFTDLPTSICHELLMPWDRPPVSEAAARVWVRLGLASVALRRREHDLATEHLAQAGRVGGAPVAAQIEHALATSFLLARSDEAQSERLLDAAESWLEHDGVSTHDRACFFARVIDQRAYPLNKPRAGAPDHAAALALYERIDDRGPPFARCRRHNGMGWSLLRLGRRHEALEHARAGVRQAGDAGSLRLRAMALNLLAHAHGDGAQALEAQQRAATIGLHLEDEELIGRYTTRTTPLTVD